MKQLISSVQEMLGRLGRAVKHRLAVFSPLRAAEDVVLLLVALQLAVLGINWVNTGSPVLGLRLEGHLVGQLYNPDFRKQTNAIIHTYENKNLSVSVADETSIVTLRQLGVNINKKQIHDTLLAEGRTGSVLTRLVDQDLAPLSARNIHLGQPGFNTELAKEYIATLDQKIDIAPQNAYFAFEHQKVVVHLDTQGRVIDAEAALAALNGSNPENNASVVLPIKQVQAVVTSSMLDAILPEVQAITQKPLTVVAGESRITFSPEQLVTFIIPKVVPDPSNAEKMTAQVTFDATKLNAIVDEVVSKAVVAPKPTVMSGGRVVQQGKSGVSTEDSHSLERVLTVLIQRQTGVATPEEARIPLVTVDPPVVQQRVASSPRTRTGTGHVRLTFDDGPGGYTDQILDILKRYNVHASFYVIGRNVNSYPGQMQRTKNEGHAICNHSFTHANLARLSRAGAVRELSDTQAAIRQTTGVTPGCFRPPYGSYNQTVREVVASQGMSLDMWSIDTRDWARPGSSVITRRVLDNTHSGAVVLLHVLNQQTVAALPSIIEGIRAQGYTLE